MNVNLSSQACKTQTVNLMNSHSASNLKEQYGVIQVCQIYTSVLSNIPSKWLNDGSPRFTELKTHFFIRCSSNG